MISSEEIQAGENQNGRQSRRDGSSIRLVSMCGMTMFMATMSIVHVRDRCARAHRQRVHRETLPVVRRILKVEQIHKAVQCRSTS